MPFGSLFYSNTLRAQHPHGVYIQFESSEKTPYKVVSARFASGTICVSALTGKVWRKGQNFCADTVVLPKEQQEAVLAYLGSLYEKHNVHQVAPNTWRFTRETVDNVPSEHAEIAAGLYERLKEGHLTIGEANLNPPVGYEIDPEKQWEWRKCQ